MSDTGRSCTIIGAERRVVLLQLLTAAANSGTPMPSTKDLCKVICAGRRTKGISTLSSHLAALRKAGKIEIVYGATQYDRRVKIIATGKLTDWQARQDGKAPKPAAEPPKRAPRPGKFTVLRALAGGYSDHALYGHLTDAVRFCRQRGDSVHRDERDPTTILINGRPGDVKTRQQWHERMRP